MKSRDSLIRLKRFQVDEKRRQVTQLEMMIADFSRMVSDLDDQIISEQNRVGIHDITHFAYPTFAKAAISRRENLKVSVKDLEDKLSDARDALSVAVEELKKIELIEERDQMRERNERDVHEQETLDEIASRRHAFGS